MVKTKVKDIEIDEHSLTSYEVKEIIKILVEIDKVEKISLKDILLMNGIGIRLSEINSKFPTIIKDNEEFLNEMWVKFSERINELAEKEIATTKSYIN